jgi:hypothetical protein
LKLALSSRPFIRLCSVFTNPAYGSSMGRPLRGLPLALALLAAAVPLVLVPASSGSAERTFQDTVGEVDCCTRDLTDVVVRNDDAGRIIFEIHFDGRPEGDDDDDLFIPLDSDRDRSTGESGDWGRGIDYIVAVGVNVGAAEGITLKRWNGTEFRDLFVRGIRASVGREVVRIALDRHLIGDTEGFRFNAQVWEVAHGSVYSDVAPDGGSWSFPLRIATRRLEPSLQIPSRPLAGRRFTARLALRVGGTRRLLGSGRVLCRASVGKAGLRAAYAAFAGRHAVCTWKVPPGLRGKTIRGSVTVAVTSRARISQRFAAVLG